MHGAWSCELDIVVHYLVERIIVVFAEGAEGRLAAHLLSMEHRKREELTIASPLRMKGTQKAAMRSKVAEVADDSAAERAATKASIASAADPSVAFSSTKAAVKAALIHGATPITGPSLTDGQLADASLHGSKGARLAAAWCPPSVAADGATGRRVGKGVSTAD